MVAAPRIEFDREALAALCRKHHIKRLAFFGSVLRDDFGPASDVDLLVVLDEALPFAERYRLVGGALLPRLFPIDLIVLGQDALDAQLEAGSPFYRDILTRGRVLYERPG